MTAKSIRLELAELKRRVDAAFAYIAEHPEGTGDLEAILRGEYDRPDGPWPADNRSA